jgi:hypothetical protein
MCPSSTSPCRHRQLFSRPCWRRPCPRRPRPPRPTPTGCPMRGRPLWPFWLRLHRRPRGLPSPRSSSWRHLRRSRPGSSTRRRPSTRRRAPSATYRRRPLLGRGLHTGAFFLRAPYTVALTAPYSTAAAYSLRHRQLQHTRRHQPRHTGTLQAVQHMLLLLSRPRRGSTSLSSRRMMASSTH